MTTGDDWCPENDGAYRAELAAINNDSKDARIRELEAERDRLRVALENLTIAIDMGWGLDGVIGAARTALQTVIDHSVPHE